MPVLVNAETTDYKFKGVPDENCRFCGLSLFANKTIPPINDFWGPGSTRVQSLGKFIRKGHITLEYYSADLNTKISSISFWYTTEW